MIVPSGDFHSITSRVAGLKGRHCSAILVTARGWNPFTVETKISSAEPWEAPEKAIWEKSFVKEKRVATSRSGFDTR